MVIYVSLCIYQYCKEMIIIVAVYSSLGCFKIKDLFSDHYSFISELNFYSKIIKLFMAILVIQGEIRFILCVTL